MNKHLILGMFAAGAMMSVTSCSSDEPFKGAAEGNTEVTFTVQLNNGLGTRTISDGLTADKLICAIYNEDGELLGNVFSDDANVANDRYEATGAFNNRIANVKTVLTIGQTYTIVCWAQNSECTVYGTDDLTNVTIDYTGVNNDEKRDAFFKTEKFTVVDGLSKTITLQRPFAQINVGITDEDLENAGKSNITVDKSSVTVENAATSINLLDGTVKGSQTVNYEADVIPVDKLYVDIDGNGEDDEYNWLSMSYILPNDETTGSAKTTLDGLSFVFSTPNGKEIVFDRGLNAVPVQRNWRTNIVGKLLTSDVEFTIVIDQNYLADYNYPDFEGTAVTVTTAEEFINALNEGKIVTLVDNITLPENTVISIEEGKTVNINLNGKTLSSTVNATSGANNLFNVNGTLNLKDGTIALDNVGSDMGDNGSTSIINIVGKGIVNADGVVFDNSGNTAVNYAVYMQNNDKVGLNATDCEFRAAYCGVCVENTGDGINTVVINNSVLSGDSKAFWVKEYVYSNLSLVAPSDATLKIDIYNRTNTFESAGDALSPICYGSDVNPMYYVLTDDARFTVNESEAALLNYYPASSSVVLPSECKGRPVTELGGYMFNDGDITSCEIPSTVKIIGNRTFRNCQSLTSITLPDGLEYIGPGAFQQSGLTSIVIPASVKTISENAFYSAHSLTSVNIPDGITRIETSSFREIPVESLDIPASVTYIGSFAMRDNKQMEYINYAGSMDQWNSIEKESNWCLIASGAFPLIIKCTDGEITIKRP